MRTNGNSPGAYMRHILSGISAAALAIAIGAVPIGAYGADDKKTDRQKDQASAEYKAAKKRADADFKAATQRCNKMKGNEKDVCMQEAKAARKKAEADAEALRDTKKAKAEAGDEKRKADYRVAKEKCDKLSGKEKDACMDQAKARYSQR